MYHLNSLKIIRVYGNNGNEMGPIGKPAPKFVHPDFAMYVRMCNITKDLVSSIKIQHAQ